MTDKESYEELDKRFSEVPLPDGEQSWQKMELLLKKEKDGRIIPPLLFRSCAPWAFLLLLLSAGAWFMWQSNNKRKEQTAEVQKQNSQTTQDDKNKTPTVYQPTEKDNPSAENQISEGKEEEHVVNKTAIGKNNIETGSNETKFVTGENNTIIPKKKSSNKSLLTSPSKNEIIKQVGSKRTIITSAVVGNGQKEVVKENRSREDKIINEKINRTTETKSVYKGDSSQLTNQSKRKEEKPALNDSVNQTLPQKEKTGQKKNKKYFIALGLGEEQQLALGGQKAVAYSYYGRKSSLSDYIPSIFIRLQKERKWFVQGEFRYGAAQSVKELSYSRQTKLDASSMYLTTTTLRLKKTYYHQLPLSFNYFLLPHLSVGAGGIYSRFYGAVTEREVKSTNVQTQVETVSREIVPIQHFTDSFFYKTQVHLLFQADYHWRKFSFGLRYTKDVQPYIKYTKPDGIVNEEKNQSLLLTLRFRLWKSGKF